MFDVELLDVATKNACFEIFQQVAFSAWKTLASVWDEWSVASKDEQRQSMRMELFELSLGQWSQTEEI